MGKKVKKRVDVFYKRAKIAGYRARSAYKLLQIENRFNVLQGSRVCIDLCAAPGSWMQVAKQTMPLSSIIIGVDLYPIKPIHGTIGIVGDITTEKVRQELKGKLNTWKADVVLHDGAPNVGQNWLHDAYQQNLLVLSAFKLACEFLRKGGSFVTKVFRSKDYFKLEYVFKKLFKTVNATKPLSSRYESAEIFVVCQSYLDPAKVDQEFFNPKNVFEEIDPEPVSKINLWKPAKTKPKAEGYPEGATILFNKVPVSEFIHASNYVEVLQTASELHFEDDEPLKKHKLTTENILENCKDIKVLGRKELKQLLTWRKEIKADFESIAKEKEKLMAIEKAQTEDSDKKDKEGEEEDEELAAIEKELDSIKFEQARDRKQKEKKSRKLKRKLLEKMQLKSLVPGDQGPTDTSTELFSLEKLSKIQNIDDIVDQEAKEVLSESEEEEEEKKDEYIVYTKDEQRLDRTGRFWMNPGDKEIDEKQDSDDEEEITKESLSFKNDMDDINLDDAPGSDKEDVDEDINPLLTDLVGDSRDARRARKANTWFNQDVFQELENEDDEDYELDHTIKAFEDEGGIVPKKKKQKETKTKDEGYTSDNSETEKALDAPEGYTESDSDSGDSDSDTDSEDEGSGKREGITGTGGGLTNATSRKRKAEEGLGPQGLALATKMIHSKKAKRDVTDAAWNRYMFGDEDDLPEWFLEDERRFNQIRIEVEPSDLRMYRDRTKDVNVQTIKKVVEAKARKQRRVKNRMEKAKKKAENIVNNEELSSREKSQEVNKLYKKAMTPLKKKETQYVVMKKRNQGHKPKGIKGPYKMVDKRMKKDLRAQKKAAVKKGRHSATKARPQKKKGKRAQ
ncbi:pre-rRNA 2'-O-ribose RNA methyltransferase FTSJ3 [Palaemon carinicauda]|uniref:pre-rRNA 2'-O-ribose RNA methyltransferase FTSJ3 n=1 Tax=Palaemon carinicauda TaxID=392227 RepID=UPI0035B61A27